MHGPSDDTLVSVVQSMLADASAAWSLGFGGAIAEFSRPKGDPPPRIEVTPRGGRVVTDRGALVVDLAVDTVAVAREWPIDGSTDWRHSLVLYRPDTPASPTNACARRVVTELGPDAEAARNYDVDDVLFDLGVGEGHVDFCVRTGDANLIAALRTVVGTPLAKADPDVLGTLKTSAPHRVCRSAIARVEVYQGIGSRRLRQPTSPGPRTHLSVDGHVTADRRPGGVRIPALTLHPAHPLCDPDGQPRPFDPDRHQAFQTLLERFAPEGWIEEKSMVTAAFHSGLPPTRFPWPVTADGRRAARVALRQLRAVLPDPAAVDPWLSVFEPYGSTVRRDH